MRLQMENEIFIIDKLRDIFNQVDYGLKRYDSKTQIFIVYYEKSPSITFARIMQEVDDVQRQRTKGMEEISEVGDEASHLSLVSVEVVSCLIDLGDVVQSDPSETKWFIFEVIQPRPWCFHLCLRS